MTFAAHTNSIVKVQHVCTQTNTHSVQRRNKTNGPEYAIDCKVYVLCYKVCGTITPTSYTTLLQPNCILNIHRQGSCKSVRLLGDRGPSPPVHSQIIPLLKIQRQESRQVSVVNSNLGRPYKIRLHTCVKQPWLCKCQNYALIMSAIKEFSHTKLWVWDDLDSFLKFLQNSVQMAAANIWFATSGVTLHRV